MPTYDTTLQRLGLLISEHERARRGVVATSLETSARFGADVVRARAPRATLCLSESVHAEGREIVVDAPHAQAVEVGSRPHFPPIAPLVEWATVRGFSDPRDVAWAVAKKIEADGTRPTWFVRGSIPEIMRITGQQVQYVLRK